MMLGATYARRKSEMPSLLRSEFTRRLLAAGTRKFSADIAELVDVPAEIETIRRMFSALGFQLEPKAQDLDHISLLSRCSGFRESAQPGDVLVAYYTSHGVRDSDRFYLLTNDSDLSDLDATAVSAEDLARRLVKQSRAAQVLIILDMCYAGGGMADIAKLAGKLAFTAGDSDPALFVIAASGFKQTAQQLAFVDALAAVLEHVDERLAGKVQPYLQIGSLIAEVNERLACIGSQMARWSCFNAVGDCLAFPNPNFRSALQSGLDLETQAVFDEHWIPKARSAELGVAGWYFTGREMALRELVSWLKNPGSDGRMRVVTGSAGSGKSALLARLVTLSDPFLQKSISQASSHAIPFGCLPPESVVDAAVMVRRKLLIDVISDLARQLSIQAIDSSSLLKALDCAGKKTVIVVDALDEADERQQIVDELLIPLAMLPRVFLLVGTRPDPKAYYSSAKGLRVESLGSEVKEIDLDDPYYNSPSDIVDYVKKRLLATEEHGRITPYQNFEKRAEEVAVALTQRINNSFLVARTAVTTLLARVDAIDVMVPDWEEQLPSGFEEALEQFFVELDQHPESSLSGEIARAVLLPLAFAEGEGLPWERIWGQIASAISCMQITDEHIRCVRQQAAPFIVEALESGGSVYRLFHEQAAEVLRASVDESRVQAAIVSVLSGMVPKRINVPHPDWSKAHPYITSYLPSHSLKAGTLDQLFNEKDGLLLASCEPSRLIVIIRSLENVSLRIIYENAFDSLLGKLPKDRLPYLVLSALQLGFTLLAKEWSDSADNQEWFPVWTSWALITPHRRINAGCVVNAIATSVFQMRFIIIIGCGDGTVRLFDLANGEPVREPLRGHVGSVRSVATGICNGIPVIVSGGVDKTIRIWNMATGESIGQPLLGHTDCVSTLALGDLDDHFLIISGSEDGSIRIWNLLGQDMPYGRPLLGHGRGINSVKLAYWSDCLILISGSKDNTIGVWDVALRELVGNTFNPDGYYGDKTDVSVTSIYERPVVVAASGTRIIAWDIARCKSLWATPPGNSGICALTTVTLNTHKVIISGGYDSSLRAWNSSSGKQMGKPLLGHEGKINSLATARLNGYSVIISGSDDRTVRVWDISSQMLDEKQMQNYAVQANAVATGMLKKRCCHVVVTGHDDKTLQAWDLFNGKPIGPKIRAHRSWVNALKVISWGKGGLQTAVVSGSHDSTLRISRLPSGEPIGMLKGHSSGVNALAETAYNGRRVIVSGGDDNTLRIWDFRKCVQLGEAHEAHDDGISALESLIIDGNTVIVSGSRDHTVRVWHLDCGMIKGVPIEGHQGEVTGLAKAIINGRPVIISASRDHTLRMLDLLSSDFIGSPLKGHDHEVTAVTTAFVNGRLVIVSGSVDNTVCIWDPSSFELNMAPLCRIRVGTSISSIAFSQNTLVVAGKAGLVAIRLGELDINV
jgi:WD40 repeat protein